MSIHRYQFSGVLAQPAKVEKTALFSGKLLDLQDAFEVIFDNSKHPAIAAKMTKALRRELKREQEKLATIMTPDIIYGVTFNGQTGEAFEVPYGQAPKRTIYTDEQFEIMNKLMHDKLKVIEEMLSLLLEQSIHFTLSQINDMEYWH